MMNLRVLIVDDEPASRKRVAALLAELEVEIVGEAGDGVAALELVRRVKPDVLLLEILMPEVDAILGPSIWRTPSAF